jgi:glutathione peroxidase
MIALLSFLALTFAGTPMSETTLYSFTLKDIDGKEVALSKFKGKTVLVVNVASKCGLTPQYAQLQKLYDAYKDKGLVILGFPANNFGGQEPGSESEIKQFCSTTYGVTFPMFSKISVKGEDAHPLYQWLTTAVEPKGDIEWNFAKFLIGKDGKVLKRFSPRVAPEAPELVEAVKAAVGS